MEIGMIGLGRMCGNMVQRLLNNGHQVVTYDRSEEAVAASQAQGATGASSQRPGGPPRSTPGCVGNGARRAGHRRYYR